MARDWLMRQISIAACLTGLATALVWFVARWQGAQTPQWMPILIAMVGGFEMFQWGQDVWLRRRARRGSL